MAQTPLLENLGADSAVATYKQLLSGILERRPSGTRQRLASALAKNRSFISQITNPLYATPIPAAHLETIFEICHFADGERREFLAAYCAAHPKRRAQGLETPARPPLTVELPDLGNTSRNERLQSLVRNFTEQMVHLISEEPLKGKHP